MSLPKGQKGKESSVLVAYATRSGSTREVAEAVAAALRDGGVEVDLQPMRNVQTLSGYRMLILGAPLYMFRWHKDAMAFLSKYKEATKRMYVAVFALGPFHDEEKEWQSVRAQFDKELAKLPWFTRPHTKCSAENSIQPNSASP
jgi:menaquinone-dependent protoporphyrinogen oxidase